MNFDRIQKFRSQANINPFVRSSNPNNTQILQTSPKKTYLPQNTSQKVNISTYDRPSVNTFISSASPSKEIRPRPFTNGMRKSSSRQLGNRENSKTGVQSSSQRMGRSLWSRGGKMEVVREKEQEGNRQIMSIVKKDIERDIKKLVDLGSLLGRKFEEVNYNSLSNGQMIEVYNLRKRVREGVIPELRALSKMADSLKEAEEGMHVILEQEEEKREEATFTLSKTDRYSGELIARSYSLKH